MTPAVEAEAEQPASEESESQSVPDLIGQAPAMQEVFRAIGRLSHSLVTVLLTGESGAGKEVVARAIWRHSQRAAKPYIAINMAAIPRDLLESELFGHEKGAFTGAVSRRIGRVEAAHTGTLFLDEIGDLSIAMQVKLLRFLQDRTFQRVGSNEERSSDVRVIAATSRNLEKLMEQGLFREDLYYRLNVFPIHLPDLAERRSDIPLLAAHFLAKFNKLHRRRIRRISSSAMNLMTAYHWPGNVRELENCIERAVLTATDDSIHSYGLPAALQAAARHPGSNSLGDFASRVEAFERTLIVEALKANRGNVAASARMLNLTIRILHYKIGKLGITPALYR